MWFQQSESDQSSKRQNCKTVLLPLGAQTEKKESTVAVKGKAHTEAMFGVASIDLIETLTEHTFTALSHMHTVAHLRAANTSLFCQFEQLEAP